jgi:cytochrome c oxidase subunit 4
MSHADHHIIPIKTLTAVIVALAILTVLTVLVSQVHLGAFNVPIALLIAGVKASLVVAIFMGLKYDNKTNALVLALGFVFVLVFLVFTLLDTSFRGDTSATTKGTIMGTEQTTVPPPAAH